MLQMKKTVLLSVLMLLATLVNAQEAKTFFVNMPDSLSPMLTANNRADCVDFLESNMKAEVTNRFGSKTEMTHMTKDYIRLQLTPQSDWQMKVLPLSNGGSVLCAVFTSCAPVCDSRVEFYDENWNLLESDHYLVLPELTDFIVIPEAGEDREKVIDASRDADILLMKADVSDTEPAVIFTFTTPEYLDKETADRLETFVRPSMVYYWKDDNKFVQGDLIEAGVDE